jgi:hypothetical protein
MPAMPFQYPKHPRSELRDPFHDERGRNPFADAGDTPAPVADDPYAAPATSDGVAQRPDAHLPIYPQRGRLVLRLGGVGLLAAVLGTCGMTALVFLAGALEFALWACVFGLLLIAAVFSAAGWLIGRDDLRALQAGAMAPDGLAPTRRGYRWAAIGTLLTCAALALFAARIGLALWAHNR